VGQNVQALTTLRALAERVPESAEARVQLAVGFEQVQSLNEARRQYRQALDVDSAHSEALRRLAALELREGRHNEVLPLARRMQAQEADAGLGYLLEGRVHSAAGDHQTAAKILAEAHSRSPSAETTIALAEAQQQLDRKDLAAQLLEDRIAEYPDETVVRVHLARALVGIGDHPGAIREYEDLVQTLPENVVVLNNLAFLYQTEGDERALEYAERAHAQAPDNPAVVDTLGWVLVNRGEVARALPLLETARRALPDRPEVRYHYATALSKAGRPAEAREELVTLLNEVESFPQRAEAEALLQTLR
jgi:cellulose synthase operon protein C